MNKELIKELQENPEKLVEFLRNFDVEILAGSLKDILFDYCKENLEQRSILFILETDVNVMGGIGGGSVNIINSLLNVMSNHPEMRDIIHTANEIITTDEWHGQSENTFKVEPNKLKS